MELNAAKLREILEYQQNRAVKNLYVSFIQILEDIKNNRYVIDEATYSNLRKKVLDSGNNTCRELSQLLQNFDVYISNESIRSIGGNNNKTKD